MPKRTATEEALDGLPALPPVRPHPEGVIVALPQGATEQAEQAVTPRDVAEAWRASDPAWDYDQLVADLALIGFAIAPDSDLATEYELSRRDTDEALGLDEQDFHGDELRTLGTAATIPAGKISLSPAVDAPTAARLNRTEGWIASHPPRTPSIQ